MNGAWLRLRHGSRSAATAVLGVLFLTSVAQAQRPDGLYAEIHTTKGRIVARLEPDLTPVAVTNFVGLAEGTIENAAFDAGRAYYDGTVFHRVVEGHVIQAGTPVSERARNPGYTFPNEIHARLNHGRAGMLNMANGGPHTNASQFCITLGDRSYLDGDYIVFGEVVEGLDVVLRVVQGDVVDSVRITRVGERAQRYRPTTTSFRTLVGAAEQRVAEHVVRKRAAEEEWVRQTYPQLSGSPETVRSAVQREGSGTRAAGDALRVRYRGREVRYVGHMLGHTGPALDVTSFGSDADGVPGFVEPQTFTFVPGTTRITPGLDSVLVTMRPGERRVVVVPADLAYGPGGLYRPEIPGQPRFVISPNTLIAYDVEALAEPGAVLPRESRGDRGDARARRSESGSEP
jgi:peptidylprolyl isomerase